MRAINHAITGAVIGLAVAEPVVAVPLALVSHFVCDAIPHWGFGKPTESALRSKAFKYSLYIDAVLCLILVMAIYRQQPLNWVLAIACAFTAASPDLISIRRYRKALAHKSYKPTAYEKFASGIQWFERPIGTFVEIVWLVAGLFVLSTFLGY